MQFSRTAKLCAALAPLSILATQTTFAVDDVNGGPLFTLTNSATAPNGVWSWFEDERAIIDNSDPLNPLLILSSVSAGGAPENGDIDLLWRNLGSGAQGEFELHNQLQQDDHDSAALYIRTDGRYLAMYSEHGSDPFTRWRVSVNPHDPTAWGPEQTLNNGAGTTYNNTYYLPGDNDGLGLLYNFTRTVNYDPNVQVSSDQGSTWSNAGKLLTEGGGGDRPYVRYASDGEKIHFIATDRHPRNFANSIYHGYVQDGVLYNSDGSVIDADLFDAAGVAPNKLTQVFANGSQFSGTTMNRAWTINMEVDNTGNPVAIFSARVNDDDDDHRFFYARYDGADWRVHEMAEAGGFLYAAENDYTGLASIDPNNPNVVYMSSEIDPITGVATGSGKYELYKGVTDDFGASWAWSAITEDSTVDNLRPVVPAWDGENTAVTWLRGTYSSYTNWSTEVVGISFAADDARSQRWNGAGGATWDAGATASWDSGGGATGVYSDGDEVAFDDSAASYTVNITSPVSPMGVAFNNSSNAYTMTGAGINGAGGLRVIGGGTVTLDNGLNTYTGQTLIAKGTLALTGGATLAGTPHIDVRAGGGLDVTSSNGGVYTLAGQVLTIAGQVNGGLNATAGSTVHINATNAINGELTAIASAVDGSGSINGNLIVQAAAVISVGAEGITPDPVQGVVTYVDANVTTNTTLADGSPMQEGADYVVRVPGEFGLANDMWELRTVFANDGQALGGNGGGPEDAPRLQTTISGLNAGETYEITT